MGSHAGDLLCQPISVVGNFFFIYMITIEAKASCYLSFLFSFLIQCRERRARGSCHLSYVISYGDNIFVEWIIWWRRTMRLKVKPWDGWSHICSKEIATSMWESLLSWPLFLFAFQHLPCSILFHSLFITSLMLFLLVNLTLP